MIIDFHTHIFPPRIKENRNKYIDSDACFATLYSSAKAKLATAEELISSMDKNGVGVSVVLNIAWTRLEPCLETNDYILEAIARYPERLVGFGTVQPQWGEVALKEIERCAKGGIKGIGEVRPDRELLSTDGEGLMTPLIEAIINYNLILLTHSSEPVGHQYPGKGGITPEVLYPFITRYPDLTIVCAHWGGGLPFYALMPEVKKALGKVFFDTAASPFLYSPEVYHQIVPLIGAERILFGSDFPLLSPARLIREIKSLDLAEEIKSQILGGNARRLLGIESK